MVMSAGLADWAPSRMSKHQATCVRRESLVSGRLLSVSKSNFNVQCQLRRRATGDTLVPQKDNDLTNSGLGWGVMRNWVHPHEECSGADAGAKAARRCGDAETMEECAFADERFLCWCSMHPYMRPRLPQYNNFE
jgi:hypothetical protein